MLHAIFSLFSQPVAWWVRHAPEAFGGWEGAKDADVCAKLTGVAANVWLATHELGVECASRIDRNVTSKAVVPLFALYVVIVFAAARSIVRLFETFICSLLIGCMGPSAKRQQRNNMRLVRNATSQPSIMYVDNDCSIDEQ